MLGAILSFSIFSPAATTFDLNADFSIQQNPNKVWEYGYSETNSLDPAQFRVDSYVAKAGALAFWHPARADRPGPGYYPYVAYNPTAKSQYGSSNGWSARAGEVAMEASNTGQYSLIRFTVPTAGIYEISARFAGVHFGLSSTDVHVLHNAQSLFDDFIEGYGGDPAFHTIEGERPTATYSGRVALQVKDTVTFACGYGRNKTHFGDTTGLFARLTLVSETPGRLGRGAFVPPRSEFPGMLGASLNKRYGLLNRMCCNCIGMLLVGWKGSEEGGATGDP